MNAKRFITLSFLVACLALTVPTGRAIADSPLPKATVQMLKQLKLNPDILSGIDKELQVPSDWVEKAKQEGEIKLFLPPTSGEVSTASFEERYPFIKVHKQIASTRTRAIKTLVAYKSGRILGDVLESAGDAIVGLKEANALTDMRDVPTWSTVVDELKDPAGLWVAQTASIYCMGYNTRLVKPADLPKTWDDLPKMDAWKHGNLGLANRPNNWVIGLWKLKGPEWTTHFMTDLFTKLDPQRRKEGQTATLQLTGAGEYNGNIPASQSATYKLAQVGAPVSLHCPDPVPSNVSEEIVLRGAPHPYAAKIYINWTLSKEGQLARQALHYAPIHKDLQRQEFIRYGETIVGKQRAFFDINDEIALLPKIMPIWEKLWLSKK